MSQDAQNKLLAADLKKADPAVYDIVQKVRWDRVTSINYNQLIRIAGETQAEALHQLDSLRELHKPGCAGCAWKCYAE